MENEPEMPHPTHKTRSFSGPPKASQANCLKKLCRFKTYIRLVVPFYSLSRSHRFNIETQSQTILPQKSDQKEVQTTSQSNRWVRPLVGGHLGLGFSLRK